MARGKKKSIGIVGIKTMSLLDHMQLAREVNKSLPKKIEVRVAKVKKEVKRGNQRSTQKSKRNSR